MKNLISLLIVLGIVVNLMACGGGGGGDSASGTTPVGTPAATATIVGSAVKGPIEGAQVLLYYFDASGGEVNIPAANAPVLTDASGAFIFTVEGRDLMGIASPLLMRTQGGSMYGGTAPILEGVIADPLPLTFAQVSLTCHLSVPSSVAAGLLKRYANDTGMSPSINTANQAMSLVEDDLNIDLADDPADDDTTLAMFNQSMDQVLDLSGTPSNNPAVDGFIDYLIANFSSTSGLLDESMDDPADPGSDIPAAFTPFGVELSAAAGTPSDFLILFLKSDTAFIENNGTDAAFITAMLMDAQGQPVLSVDQVLMGLSSGSGSMSFLGYDYGSGESRADLVSSTAGANIIQAELTLANAKVITEQITITAVDLIADADNDGFADGEEQMGWEIIVDKLGYGSDGQGQLLSIRQVTSDPVLADTDGDGLDDYTEYLAGSDPRAMDTDGDGLTDAEELNRWHSSPIGVDTDGDARGPGHNLVPNSDLFDGNELSVLSTSPTLDDTDGDGRTDYEEYDHPTRSALVSDLPKLELEIVDAVDVRLDVTYAEEEGNSFEYGSELMESTTETTSRYNEQSIGLGVELGYSFSIGAFPKGTVSAKMSFDYGKKWSTTQTSSETTQQSHSQYTTDSRTRTETAATGSMSAGIRLRNPSNISYSLSKLGITVRHWELDWNEEEGQVEKSYQSVATLVPSLGSGFTLAPGEATPVLQVTATGLNADRVKELLRRPDSLYLEAAYFDLENADMVNYDFLKEINTGRTASIIIDPGQMNAEEYRVATNVQRDIGGNYAGITLDEILTDILRIDYTTAAHQDIEPASPTNEQVLFSLRGQQTDLADPTRGFWVVVHESEYPPSGLYDFEDIPVRAGDRVLIIYVRDDDDDGLTALEEQHYGTFSPGVSDADHDGDNLSDYEEVRDGWQVDWTDASGVTHTYKVLSDPTNTDQDDDGLDDYQERIEGTNPSNPDTDRDGIFDGDDEWPLYQARVVYVDQSASGAGTGLSWTDAYTDLQSALAVASTGQESTGDATDDVAEIWVAAGIYTPSADDRTVSFELVDSVSLYGGFRGGETLRSHRNADPITGNTTLSGDLNADDEYPYDQANTVFSDNSYQVVSAGYGLSPATVVDGFIITGGINTDYDSGGGYVGYGAGLHSQGALTLRNLFFVENHARHGSAISISLPSDAKESIIHNCVFTRNGLLLDNFPTDGGAIYVIGPDNAERVQLLGCTFTYNQAQHGGAVKTRNGVKLDVEACSFQLNSALRAYTLAQANGGAISSESSRITISRSRFTHNHADSSGGAVVISANDALVVQSAFWGNTCVNYGAGICAALYTGNPVNLRVANTTLANNQSENQDGAGIYYMTDSACSVENSILWGNTNNAQATPTAQWQIYSESSSVQVNTSCVQDHTTYFLTAGAGNTGDDPHFINAATGDLRISANSGVIDRGNNYVDFDPITIGFQALPQTDIAGYQRIVDGNEDGEPVVDMGAYEYQGD